MRILRNIVLLVAGAAVMVPLSAVGAHADSAGAGHPAPAVLAAQASAGRYPPVGQVDSVHTPVGTPVTVKVKLHDNDTPIEDLRVTLINPIDGVEFDPATNTLHVPATEPVPLTVLKFHVTDGLHIDLFENTVSVYHVPRPTITLAPEAVEVQEGQAVDFQLTVDPDGRNDLEVTIPDLPDWLVWDKNTNRISGKAHNAGVFTFTVQADGKTYATGKVTVTAKPAPSPSATPTATASPSATATETAMPSASSTASPEAAPQPQATASAAAPGTASPGSTTTTSMVVGASAPSSSQGTSSGSLARTGTGTLFLSGLAVGSLALGAASVAWRRIRRAD